MTDFDIAIVGAGIAGASLAHALAPHRSVLLLEAEAQPGYHATGRSVAFWNESYGGPTVQPLTTASGPFLRSPPPDFHSGPFVQHRGALHIGRSGEDMLAQKLIADFAVTPLKFESLPAERIAAQVPGLRSGWDVAVYEDGCYDIDVSALHGGYLASAKRHGTKLLCNAALTDARFHDDGWTLQTKAGAFTADMVVNAAGAWADPVAQICSVAKIGITPLRRTVLQLRTDPEPSGRMPLVLGLDGSFYFKTEPNGRIWLTPHDETPSLPCDAAPEETDIAVAIDRFTQLVDWRIAALEHKWAGLRSFAPDRLPVIGRDVGNAQFFWMAGQGGFGIQTAPAAAQLAASLILEDMPPPGILAAQYRPDRF